MSLMRNLGLISLNISSVFFLYIMTGFNDCSMTLNRWKKLSMKYGHIKMKILTKYAAIWLKLRLRINNTGVFY